MQINGYHHIGLIVEDVERSLKFYVDGLGGKEIFSFPMGSTGKTIHMVDLGGNAVVEILPRGTEEAEANARWAHICLATDDTRNAYAQALEAGAISRTEPRDGSHGERGMCNAFVFGPDNEIIEFYQTK